MEELKREREREKTTPPRRRRRCRRLASAVGVIDPSSF